MPWLQHTAYRYERQGKIALSRLITDVAGTSAGRSTSSGRFPEPIAAAGGRWCCRTEGSTWPRWLAAWKAWASERAFWWGV